MAGLVGYASSDEGSGDEQPQNKPIAESRQDVEQRINEDGKKEVEDHNRRDTNDAEEPIKAAIPHNAVPLGPSLPPGPSMPPLETDIIETDSPGLNPDADDAVPPSPYSSNRALIQELTLPTVPDFDIPPSPPGSPPPGLDKKFEQFLDLKKKGIHFNSKLESSSALKNPSLMDKLLGFVDVDARAQYETTLPAELWNPRGFPEWAYKDKLKKSHEQVARQMEADKATGTRSTVEFTSSTTIDGSDSTPSKPAGLSRGERSKSQWG